MKRLFFLLFSLLTGYLYVHAQTPEPATMVQMIEWKYKSAKALLSTYGVTRAYWMEKVPEITSRFGFTSESGRFYGFTNTVGQADLGKYIGAREQVSEAFKKDHPDVYKSIMDNMDGPSIRSYWKIVDEISNTAPDYNPNNFNFRKMILFSVPIGMSTTFQDLMKDVLKQEKKAGIDLTRLYAQSTDGYPSNYYILMYPDADELSYYQKKSQREAIRNANPELLTLLEKVKSMMTIVRIDHLNRIQF